MRWISRWWMQAQKMGLPRGIARLSAAARREIGGLGLCCNADSCWLAKACRLILVRINPGQVGVAQQAQQRRHQMVDVAELDLAVVPRQRLQARQQLVGGAEFEPGQPRTVEHHGWILFSIAVDGAE